MVELMPFGNYQGKSIEQIALADYKYFAEFLVDGIEIRKRSLRNRIQVVEYVLNHFKPVLPCGYDDCEEIPRYISIYNGYGGIRTSSTDFIYCSQECFDADPKVTIESHKPVLTRLGFRAALSGTKFDTKQLVEVLSDCMGLKEGRKTKEYLEHFIDEKECWPGRDPRPRSLF